MCLIPSFLNPAYVLKLNLFKFFYHNKEEACINHLLISEFTITKLFKLASAEFTFQFKAKGKVSNCECWEYIINSFSKIFNFT